jgi:hypothetical protein
MKIQAITLCTNCRYEFDKLVGEKITLNFMWVTDVIIIGEYDRYNELIHCPRCNNTQRIIEVTPINLQ